MEQWRNVVGFPGYEVSDLGNVRSYVRSGRGGLAQKPRPRKPVPDKDGYMYVILRRSGKSHCGKIHRMVLEAFVGPCPQGMESRHHNGKAADNRLSNLSWSTHTVNNADRVAHGTDTRGSRNGMAKLTSAQVMEIRASSLRGKQLSEKFGVAQSTISLARRGIRYV